MSPTLRDENLRRLLLIRSISPPPRAPMSPLELVLLTAASLFYVAFFFGLVIHLILDL